MREFMISNDDANQRLDKFVLKTVKKMPKSLLYKSIRNKKIKVNRKRCEANQRLAINDTVQMFLSEDLFEEEAIDFTSSQLFTTDQIVYEDEHIIVLNKEAGVLCHSEKKEDQDTLIQRLWHYLYEKGEFDPNKVQSFKPALANRIDRNTQGIVLAAKDATSLRALNEIIRSRKLKKIYHCIIEGKMKKHDTLILYHQKQTEQNKALMSMTFKEGYQETKTSYQELHSNGNYSLLEVELHTGKSHQIRSSFAFLHHPLYGDVKYGAKKRKYHYQALCSYQVEFLDLTDDPQLEALAYLSFQKMQLKTCEIDELYKQIIK